MVDLQLEFAFVCVLDFTEGNNIWLVQIQLPDDLIMVACVS